MFGPFAIAMNWDRKSCRESQNTLASPQKTSDTPRFRELSRRPRDSVRFLPMPQILLEICCGSIDDAIESEKGGAHRVELCSALFLGGLTPSIGTIHEAKLRLKIPVMVMVRPRAGGFCYTSAEMSTMERGADGIVFGILTTDGKIDAPRSQRIRRLIGDKQSIFHRAFDVTPDPFEALEQLIDMGITRVLTSGQKDSVPQGGE